MRRTVTINDGPLKGRTTTTIDPGDACDICAGPCLYGNCKFCGGHSEHNHGCRTLPRSHGGRA